MEYALAVARTSSFSKAAKELFVSQPNISASINSLESQLGFNIFHRTNQGITITLEGEEFLNHAKNIMYELEKVSRIIDKEPYREFSVGCMFNHTCVSEAFLELCKIYEKSPKLSFTLYTGSSRDIIEGVYQNKSNLGIILINNIVLDSYINTMSNKNLDFKVIKNMNINVNLRNGHPLLQEESFDFTSLYDYPFVNYNFNSKSNPSLASEFHDILSTGLVDIDKMINVDERETRRQIVLSTDAFSIGATFHPDMEAIDEIVSLSIPKLKMFLVLITKDNQPPTEELNKFIELFNTELKKIVSA